MNGVHALIGAAALACATTMGGCLANGSSSVKSSGQYVSKDTLALIESGASSERELLDLLGRPSRTMHHHDGRTIYVYDYKLDAKASGGVFLFVAGSSRKNIERTTYFEVKEGVVTRFWTDGPHEDVRDWAKDCDIDLDEGDWEEIG